MHVGIFLKEVCNQQLFLVLSFSSSVSELKEFLASIIHKAETCFKNSLTVTKKGRRYSIYTGTYPEFPS
jgi:hypothetical protein